MTNSDYLRFVIDFDHQDEFDKPHFGPVAQGGVPISLIPSVADFASERKER